MILTAILLTVSCLRPANGSEVVITVTGTLNGGRDMLGVFGMPNNVMPAGTPYTLVFTFNEANGKPLRYGCPNAGSGLVNGLGSSAIAVLTINGKSYPFGLKPDARSKVWRTVATICSDSEIGMSVQEGQDPLMTGVNIKIMPNPGQRSLTQSKDWKDALSLSSFDARNADNAFAIQHDHSAETMSYLSVSTVTVSGPHAAAPKAAVVTAPAPKPVPVILPPRHPHPIGPEVSRIYVLSEEHGCKITTYSVDGKDIGPTMVIGGMWCTGIAVDAAGKIYVSRAYPINQLVCFLPDGTRVPPLLSGGGSHAIAVDDSGKIYLLIEGEFRRGVVKTFTPDGKPSLPIIKTGLGNADGLAIDEGKIYVVSQYDDVVKAYSATGEPSVPTVRGGINVARAVAVAPDGRIYVANDVSVTAYAPDGQRIPSTIMHRNPATGGLDSPWGLAVDSRGRLYIGYASGMVGIFGPDGKPFTQGFMAARDIKGIAVH
jgi:DNA-binding beta-propeller fold protein YncE